MAHESQTCAPLVRLDGANVTRNGSELLTGIRLALRPGERLALLGDNGAGKSTLLKLLRGDILPDPAADNPNVRLYHLPGQQAPQTTALGLRQRLALVSGDMQDRYARNEWAITALEAVLTGFDDTPLLYAEPTAARRQAAERTLARLGLTHLSRKRMALLSSGQGRAVLLARALVCAPAALFLDECLEGLDTASRRLFLDALDRATATDPALAMIFCSHRAEELPRCLTEGALLENGRLVARGGLDWVLERFSRQKPPAQAGAGADGASLALPEARPAAAAREFLARIEKADVTIGGNDILNGIDWTIRPGEHWAVLGANGAGKSTLLSLLAGEFWPSALRGRPGTVAYGFAPAGETLDDTRRRMGRVSAAFDRDYGWDLTVREVVWSGSLGSIGLYAEAEPAAKARTEELLEFFGLAGLAQRRISGLSRGQLRRVTLARALLGFRGEGPALLLLDEPMAGLDARARRRTRELIGRVAAGGTAVVMVTHHEADLPEQINRVLVLEAGSVVYRGDRAAWRKSEAPGR